MTGHQLVPCADCDEARRRLEERGYTVLGCTADPGGSALCRLEFEWIDGAQHDPAPAQPPLPTPPTQQGAPR